MYVYRYWKVSERQTPGSTLNHPTAYQTTSDCDIHVPLLSEILSFSFLTLFPVPPIYVTALIITVTFTLRDSFTALFAYIIIKNIGRMSNNTTQPHLRRPTSLIILITTCLLCPLCVIEGGNHTQRNIGSHLNYDIEILSNGSLSTECYI